jgi:hypothetical protein
VHVPSVLPDPWADDDDITKSVRALGALSPDARIGAMEEVSRRARELSADPYFRHLVEELVEALNTHGELNPPEVAACLEGASEDWIEGGHRSDPGACSSKPEPCALGLL